VRTRGPSVAGLLGTTVGVGQVKTEEDLRPNRNTQATGYGKGGVGTEYPFTSRKEKRGRNGSGAGSRNLFRETAGSQKKIRKNRSPRGKRKEPRFEICRSIAKECCLNRKGTKGQTKCPILEKLGGGGPGTSVSGKQNMVLTSTKALEVVDIPPARGWGGKSGGKSSNEGRT